MSLNSISEQRVANLTGLFPRRALTMGEVPVDDCHIYSLTVDLYTFNPKSNHQKVTVEFHKRSTTEELIEKILEKQTGEKTFKLTIFFSDLTNCNSEDYDIYEMMGTLDGRTFKQRRLDRGEYPVTVQTLWLKPSPVIASEDPSSVPQHRFVLRLKDSRNESEGSCVIVNTSTIDVFLVKFLQQPQVTHL